MKISQLFSDINFYGSLVEGLEYLEDDQTLRLNVELCNWKQNKYLESEPEMVLGKLVFNHVTRFLLQPNMIDFDSDEILEISIENDLNMKDEMLKLVLLGEGDVKVLEILGGSVEWKEEK